MTGTESISDFCRTAKPQIPSQFLYFVQ